MLPPHKLQLTPGQHPIEIHYTALEFSSPEKLRFRYRMEGLDRDWNYDSGSRAVRYSQLPPGRYTFQLTAALADSSWGPVETFVIEQTPEFYQTKWFHLLAGLLILLSAVLIFLI